MAVIRVSERTVNPAAGRIPKKTCVAVEKPLPVIETAVSLPWHPVVGEKSVMEGGAT